MIIKKFKKDYKFEVIDYGVIIIVIVVMKNYYVKYVFLLFLINLLKFIFVFQFLSIYIKNNQVFSVRNLIIK